MRSRSAYPAALVALLVASCALVDTSGGSPRFDEPESKPAIVEDFAISCELLCAVPGGIEECPTGTRCPRLHPDEADKKLESPAALLCGAGDSSDVRANIR